MADYAALARRPDTGLVAFLGARAFFAGLASVLSVGMSHGSLTLLKPIRWASWTASDTAKV